MAFPLPARGGCKVVMSPLASHSQALQWVTAGRRESRGQGAFFFLHPVVQMVMAGGRPQQWGPCNPCAAVAGFFVGH